MKLHPYSIIGYLVSGVFMVLVFLLDTSAAVTEAREEAKGDIVIALDGISTEQEVTSDLNEPSKPSAPSPQFQVDERSESRGNDQDSFGEIASKPEPGREGFPQVKLSASWDSVAGLVTEGSALIVLYKPGSGISGIVDVESGQVHSEVNFEDYSSQAIRLRMLPDWVRRTAHDRGTGENIALLFSKSAQQQLQSAQVAACESAGRDIQDVYSTTISIQSGTHPFLVREIQ